MIELEKENISVSSISRMISSIKSYHDYLFFNGLAKMTQQKHQKPKVKREEVEILTEEEVDKLLKFEDLSTPKKKEIRLYLKFYMGQGLKFQNLLI